MSVYGSPSGTIPACQCSDGKWREGTLPKRTSGRRCVSRYSFITRIGRRYKRFDGSRNYLKLPLVGAGVNQKHPLKWACANRIESLKPIRPQSHGTEPRIACELRIDRKRTTHRSSIAGLALVASSFVGSIGIETSDCCPGTGDEHIPEAPT